MKLCLRCNQYFNDTLEVCPKDQVALEPVGKDPLIGALIDDRYVIDSIIGKGSSGIVYKASRLMMGGEVAVKVIHSYLGADSASLDRLLRELKAAERLRHAHIITVWDSGTTDDGQPYLVMDYLEGITLSQLITQKGALPPKRVLNVIRQVTEALAHAHDQGLIHRDMKPENVVLEESEIRGDYVKVLDFGIADTVQESAARTKFNKPKTVAGSPAYMSPEQCQGFELEYRSDLYSVAVIVYEMFTGRRPFLAHDLMKLMYMTVTEPPPKMGAVRKDLSFPERVEAVVAKALSKLPEDRQPTIRDFWRDLESACAGLEFGKSDRAKLISRENQNVSDLEIPSTERLIDDDKPKRPQFELGPEDMPELFMPPPPPPKAEGAPSPPGSPPKPGGPPPPGGPPKPAGGMSNLINKQQVKPGLPSNSNTSLPGQQGSTMSGTVKPLQPARIGPGGSKPAGVAPQKPAEPAKPGQLPPAGVRPGAPPAPGAPRPGGPPPGPAGAKPGSGAPASGLTPPLPQAKPGAPGAAVPQKSVPPPMPVGGNSQPNPADSERAPQGKGQQEALPDKTMNRLSALVKRPTTSMSLPGQPESKPAAAAEPAPERPPSVYSYVPPSEKKEEKPAEPAAKPAGENNQRPGGAPQGAKPGMMPGKPGGPGPAGAKPGGPGPGGVKTAGPGGPGGPGGAKPGGPGGAKPGGVLQSKAVVKPGGPGPQGAKPGEPATGAKPGGPAPVAKPGAPVGQKIGPGNARPAPAKEPGPNLNKPAEKPAAAEPEPSEHSAHGDELTPALARAGATWVDHNDSLDGHVADAPERRMSNLDWEDEVEALKTGNVAPIVIEPLKPAAGGTQWPPGVAPPGVPQVPGQAPPPGYPTMQQSWPPGMMQPVPGQPMMPPYDQSMSYPPGMMHPYMQQPGYPPPPGYPQQPGFPPPGYPMPPTQDVSGAYPMYPLPPNQEHSGAYPMMPGYQMPPPQGYPYGPPGMPMMVPGMPPQGMPPGMPPQGMPPGMPPQGMPPGMPPQGMPPGMPPGMPQGPGQMPPFMNPQLPGQDTGLGSALMEDLKSDFGEQSGSSALMEDLFEGTASEPASSGQVESKEPQSVSQGLSALLGSDDKSGGFDFRDQDDDDDEKARALAAKSAAEAEELGDSLLALMDATEKDRMGGISQEKSPFEPEKSEFKPAAASKKEGKGLGSLLGALTTPDEEIDELVPEPESEVGGGNAFADAVASSASNPSLTEKTKKDNSGSAFGQLLAAVKDEDEPDAEPAEESGSQNVLPKKAIEDALEQLLPEPAPGGVQNIPSMKNPFEADDDLLGTAASGSTGGGKKDEGMTAAAARLAAAMSDEPEDEEPLAYGSDLSGSVISGAASQNPSTSTSDALSRLLEAASKAPSKASDSGSGNAMSDIDKMAARVNKPQAKVSRKLASVKSAEADAAAAQNEPQPFGGGGFGGGFGGGGGGGAFGGGDSVRTGGGTGTNSSYSQDAVNARIAELNRKLEAQSVGRDNVELPPAPAPDPSVIGDPTNRRDVVNRIMEEAAMRHQYGADYEPPAPTIAGKPSTSGTDFSASELDKVNNSRLASMAEAEQRRKKTSRSRATMPRFPVIPVIAGVIIVGLAGYGFMNQDAVIHFYNDTMAKFAPSVKGPDDSDMIAHINELISTGKLSEAKKVLEKEEDEKGLPPELSEKLDLVYLGIAKYKKNSGATNEAIEHLKLIPNESSHYAEAQKLLKQYQKGGKKPPKRRKR